MLLQYTFPNNRSSCPMCVLSREPNSERLDNNVTALVGTEVSDFATIARHLGPL